MKITFCDIDGTLTTTLSGHKFKQHPRDVKILEGADKAITHYYKEGWLIIGISNQGGVGAGYKLLDDAIAEMRCTLQLFPQILCIYFCPDFDGNVCWCVTRTHDLEVSGPSAYRGQFRKPQPGMLLHALAAHDGDRAKSWYVGDRPEDEQAADSAGINFINADVWRERFTSGKYKIPQF